jgi:hypothetical protein
MLLRYDLDRLGWHDFEGMVAILLRSSKSTKSASASLERSARLPGPLVSLSETRCLIALPI